MFVAATLKPKSHRKDSEGEAEDRGFAQILRTVNDRQVMGVSWHI